MPDAKKQGRSNKAMTFFVCFLAALAGLLFGLDIGVIAGALPFIADEFQITSHTQEWVVSSMMFGAAVGAVGSGWLSFKLGRKKSLMIGAILFVAGSLFSAAAPNVEVLILSRVLLGLAVGVASYTAPLYLSEIAPEKIRGSMISMYQLMITIGIDLLHPIYKETAAYGHFGREHFPWEKTDKAQLLRDAAGLK